MWDLRNTSPMLDVRLFKDRRFGVSSLGLTLVFLTMFGFFFVVSQLFQLVLGYGSFESGLRMLPIMPVLIIFSTRAAGLVERLGARTVVTTGMVLTAAGVFILSFLSASSGYGHVLVGMVVMGAGMGLTMTPMTELIMSSVPRDKAGVGSAMNDTTREVGTTLGVAVLGSILSSGYTSNLHSAVADLPGPARQAAEGSLAGALGVARDIGGTQGAAIVDAAKSAWADGLQMSMLIGTGIVLLAAAISARYLPGKLGGTPDEAVDFDSFDDELDGLAVVRAD
jgi:Na+/melibiose symporter-like transporter